MNHSLTRSVRPEWDRAGAATGFHEKFRVLFVFVISSSGGMRVGERERERDVKHCIVVSVVFSLPQTWSGSVAAAEH